jgi:hypothetical protein
MMNILASWLAQTICLSRVLLTMVRLVTVVEQGFIEMAMAQIPVMVEKLNPLSNVEIMDCIHCHVSFARIASCDLVDSCLRLCPRQFKNTVQLESKCMCKLPVKK